MSPQAEGPPFREGDFESVVRWFAAGWDDPGSAERFCAHFLPGMHDHVRLIQPGAPTVTGHQGFQALFEPVFELIPDLRADVHRWAGKGDSLYIEFTLSGTMGRRTSWRAVDRLTLADGQVVERWSFFDPTPSRAAVLRQPRSWPRAARVLADSLRRR
jgi:predicted SnoaL-like aldol condensation-catalyzing enzyme